MSKHDKVLARVKERRHLQEEYAERVRKEAIEARKRQDEEEERRRQIAWDAGREARKEAFNLLHQKMIEQERVERLAQLYRKELREVRTQLLHLLWARYIDLRAQMIEKGEEAEVLRVEAPRKNRILGLGSYHMAMMMLAMASPGRQR